MCRRHNSICSGEQVKMTTSGACNIGTWIFPENSTTGKKQTIQSSFLALIVAIVNKCNSSHLYNQTQSDFFVSKTKHIYVAQYRVVHAISDLQSGSKNVVLDSHRAIISISRQVIGAILVEYNNTQAVRVRQRAAAHFYSEIVLRW